MAKPGLIHMEMTLDTKAVDFDVLLPEAADYVYELFKERLDESLLFHGYQHTLDVVKTTQKIAKKEELPKDEYNLVVLAAWLHDTGFVEKYDGHEEESARLAREFLESKQVDDEIISEVESLILATRPEAEPQNRREAVLRDADIAHIGQKKFFERSERLRAEWEHYHEREYTDQEWTEQQLEFLTAATFTTDYAKKKYGDRRKKNVRRLREQLAAFLEEKKPMPEIREDKGLPKRGIETMYRSAYRTHINLSSIADAKANIMISINAILMSIIVSFISTRAEVSGWLLAPSGILLIGSLIAIVFAILSARPKVTSKYFTLEDIRKNRSNILFFGNFVNLPIDTFKHGLREIMDDWDLLYDSMSSDLYGLGKVLDKKYRLLWISYTVFMGALVVSVVTLIVLFFFFPNFQINAPESGSIGL